MTGETATFRYKTITAQLMAEICAGTYPVGSLLPPELDWSDRLDR
jgi:DNA-binding FadR family transcriptional regulator